MKKILVVHSSGITSGGEEISRKIYIKLKNNFNFYFFIPCIKSDANLIEKESRQYYASRSGVLSIILSLRKTITELKPSIIHAHGTRASFFIKLALLITPKRFKFFYTIHGFHIAHRGGLKNKIKLAIEKITNYIFVDKIVCVGEDDYQIIKSFSWRKETVIKINNGVECPTIKKDEEIELFCQKYRHNILTISRLHYQKDVSTLIKSIFLLDKNIGLVIIGDGPQKKQLENLADKADNIIFIKRKSAASFIHYFDAFVLSTNWEGLPLVILESMLSRVPVIGSRVHGVRELIEDNETGLLCEPKNAENLAKKIKIIVNNKIDLKNITNNAFNFTSRSYTIERMIQQYKNLYLNNYENTTNK